MKQPRVYYVRPAANGRWSVQHQRAARPARTFADRASAVEGAKQLSRLSGSDFIVVCDLNGRSERMPVERFNPRWPE